MGAGNLNRKQRRALRRSSCVKKFHVKLAKGLGLSAVGMSSLMLLGQSQAYASVLPCYYSPPVTVPANNAQCDPSSALGHCFAGGDILYGPTHVSGTEATISRDNPGVFGATSAWVMLAADPEDFAQVGWIKVSGSFPTNVPGTTGTPMTSNPGYFYEINYIPGSNGCIYPAATYAGECQSMVFLNTTLPTTSLADSDLYAVWTNGGQLEFQIDNGSTLSVPYGTIATSSPCSSNNVPWVACGNAAHSEWDAEMFDYGDELPGSVSQPALFSGIAHLCPSGCNPAWTPDTQLSTSNFGTDDCHGVYSQSGTSNSFTIYNARRTSSK